MATSLREAGTTVRAYIGAHVTRRQVLAGSALGVAAAGLPQLSHAAPNLGGIINYPDGVSPPARHSWRPGAGEARR